MPSHWPISILSILASFVNMAMPLLLVRILAAEEVGSFKIFYLYLLLVHGLSFAPGFMNGLSFWAGQKEPERRRAIQASSVILLCLAFLLFFTALAGHGFIADAFGWPREHALIFAFALLGANPAMFFDEAAIASGRIWAGAIFSSSLEVLRSVAVILTAWFYPDLTAIFAVYTGITLFRFLLGYSLALKFGLFGFDFDRAMFLRVCRYAFPVSLAAISVILVSNADQVLVSIFMQPDEFALYAIGCLAVPPLFIFEQSITRVLIPRLAEKFAASDSLGAAALYSEAVGSMTFLTLPAVAGLIVFASPIIEFLFTKEYLPAAAYLQLFALSYMVLVIPYDAVARARGEASWILKSYSFFSVFSLLVSLAGIYLFGASGALIAILFSRFLMRGHAIIYMRDRMKCSVMEFLPGKVFARQLTIVLLLSLASIAARPYFSSDQLWFFFCTPVYAAIYFLLEGVQKYQKRAAVYSALQEAQA